MAGSTKHKGFKNLVGDESNPTFGIAVGETSRALHIITADDYGTDWNVSADTHPSVYIHSATTPETYYMKLYHDGTYGYLNIAGTTVLTATASALATALPLTSTSTTSISFNPTLVPDSTRTNYIWSYGTRATAKSLSMAASADYNLDPVQMNLSIIGTAPTSSTVNLSYMLITHSFANMTGLRLKCSDWNISVAKNVKDVYVYQGELDFTASSAVGGEACVMGMLVNATAGTVSGNVWGLVIAMAGASMPATSSTGVFISARNGATLTNGIELRTQADATMTNVILIDGTVGTMTNVLKFAGTSAAVVSTSSGGGTRSYSIRCAVGAVTGYLSLYTN